MTPSSPICQTGRGDFGYFSKERARLVVNGRMENKIMSL